MIRMSMLRNIPVICQDRQQGLLQSVSLDETRKRVRALIVSCGIRGKKVVPAEQICSIAKGFILVEGAQAYRREKEAGISPFVRDTTGVLAGRVTDYAVDIKTLSVLAAEIIPGYCPPENKCRIWVYAYNCPNGSSGDLIVPASLGSELIFSREGDGACAYPP